MLDQGPLIDIGLTNLTKMMGTSAHIPLHSGGPVNHATAPGGAIYNFLDSHGLFCRVRTV